MVGINQVGLKILSEVAHVIGGWSGVPGSGVEQEAGFYLAMVELTG